MDGRDYCRALAERLTILIGEADNAREAMDEIANAAERGGLIDNSSLPRRESATAFVMDLLLENPTAGDWMTARLEWLKPTGAYESVSDVAEHLT